MKISNISYLKLFLLVSGIILVSSKANFINAQNWVVGGNSISSGNFLGTTNAFALNFEADNQLAMSILPYVAANPNNNIEILGNYSLSMYTSGDNYSLFFGQDQIPTNPYGFGKWGIQYVPSAQNSGLGGGLNFWIPYVGSQNPAYGNGYLWLSDIGNVGVRTSFPIAQFQVNSLTCGWQLGNNSVSLGGMGDGYGSSLGIFPWSYIGFNAARSSTGTWSRGTDGECSGTGGGTGNNGAVVLAENAAGSLYFVNIPSNNGGVNTIGSDDNVLNNTSMLLTNTGQLVIGNDIIITTPNWPNTYGLYVSKGILTTELKIALTNTPDWSDYVFANNYKLRPLTEVAQYIQENKHLPDVPSASDVKKDGINVADMDATLLKKVEELTLYILQQQKEIDELKKQVAEKPKEGK